MFPRLSLGIFFSLQTQEKSGQYIYWLNLNMGMVVNCLNWVNCHYLIDQITFDPVYIYFNYKYKSKYKKESIYLKGIGVL